MGVKRFAPALRAVRGERHAAVRGRVAQDSLAAQLATRLDTQRALDRWVGVPLCALLSLFARLFPRRGGGTQRAILIVLLSEAGSWVCTQPMIRRLRARYPQATLYALVLERHRASLEILRLVAPEHIVTLEDRSLGRVLLSAARAIAALRRARIDTVIDCELFARVSAVLAYLSGARVRVGFHRLTQEGLYRGSLLNRPVGYNPYQHIATQFLTLAAALEASSRPIAKTVSVETPTLEPLEFSPTELAAASTRLYADFPTLRTRRMVLLYPGAGPLPVRAWPLDSFRQLAASLIAQGYAVGIIGLAGDRELAHCILEHCASRHCLDLTGYTATLRELLLLFHDAALLVSNDGGPVHFAALTPLPILALFGPETPVLYGPLSPRAQSLIRALPCSPCLTAYNHRRSPCDGDNQCLKQLSVAEVHAAARRLLETSASASASVPRPAVLRSVPPLSAP